MKTDAELELIAGRVHGELQLSWKNLDFRKAVIDRLRQLEHDAIRDFIGALKIKAAATRIPLMLYASEIEDLARELGIPSAPSAGCKDGKCGVR